MREPHNPIIVRFCLVLSLAVALVALGLVIFLEYISLGDNASLRLSPMPGGGLIALLLGVSLLALLFHKTRVGTALALVTVILALCQFALQKMQAPGLAGAFGIGLPLLLVALLTELNLFVTFRGRKSKLVRLISSPAVVALGIFSMVSNWYPPLEPMDIGTIPESTIIASPLTVLLGLTLPFFRSLHQRSRPAYSSGLIPVGTLGIVLTFSLWYAMRAQGINSLLLPAMVLFGGLILSFLMMLSHMFWQEAERRAASLQQLDQEREQFFSLSPDMFCIVNLDGHFFELNRAFVDVLDYEREELLGAAYMQLIHRDDRARVENAVTSMMDGNTISELHIRVIDKNNSEHWLEVSAALGADELIYVAARDTTDILRAQEELRQYAERQARVFESITDAFFTLDPEWRFTYVNQRSEELLRKSRDQLLGQSVWDMFPEALDSEFETQYQRAVETGESVAFEAYYAPLEQWLEVSAYPSNDGLAVYYRSINERKRAQQQLEETMAELERSNRELQDFAFVASHDLQEPLRKIQAFSDRLLTRSDRFNEQEQDYLRRMQSAAQRMQSLVRDLLAYSRVTTRAQPLTRCNTDRILEEVLQDMETAIAQEKAVVDTKPLPPVIGDATQIRQVFQNLLSNAIKFHLPGQAPHIMIYPEYNEENSWTLVVSDNGVGFDTRYAGKLFNPFQRLHKQTFPGTGIGLAIVKKILDRHGATVTVDSKVDQGTIFRIGFPASEHTKGSSHD